MKITVKWFGEKVAKELRAAERQAMLDSLEFVLQEANKSVPIDEGTLQRSAETSYSESKHEGAISYDTPYAVRLHEHPEYRFQRGRKGKWLEQALKNTQSKVAKFIQDRIKNALR